MKTINLSQINTEIRKLIPNELHLYIESTHPLEKCEVPKEFTLPVIIATGYCRGLMTYTIIANKIPICKPKQNC